METDTQGSSQPGQNILLKQLLQSATSAESSPANDVTEEPDTADASAAQLSQGETTMSTTVEQSRMPVEDSSDVHASLPKVVEMADVQPATDSIEQQKLVSSVEKPSSVDTQSNKVVEKVGKEDQPRDKPHRTKVGEQHAVDCYMYCEVI